MTRPPAKKPTSAAKPSLKSVGTPASPKPESPAAAAGDDIDAPELRKKTLVERVAEKVDVKRKVAREVVEVVLAEIGAALSRGESLNLPPLGKAKVNRQKEQGSAEVIVVKLRRSGKPGGAKAQEDLAEPND